MHSGYSELGKLKRNHSQNPAARSENGIQSQSIETHQTLKVIPNSSMRKDSVFEGGTCTTEIREDHYQIPIMNGFLCLAMGKSKSHLIENGVQKAKKTWCCIDGNFSIYTSFSSHFKKEPPMHRLPCIDYTVSPILLDGGNIVAIFLKSKSSDACLIAYSPAGPKETIRWTRSLIQCNCTFKL